MTFGEKLKDLRIQKRLSQAAVAREISEMFPDYQISQTYLSTLENSIYAPKEDLLEVLATYYMVPITFFFDKRRKSNANVRSYLESLRSHTPSDARRFASSSKLRNDIDDEIQENLDDELLDTD